MQRCISCWYGVGGVRGSNCPMGSWINKGFAGGCNLHKPKEALLAPVEPSGVKGRSLPAKKAAWKPDVSLTPFSLVLKGSIRGGKNSVQITRSGHRYPNPVWAAWRDEMVCQIKAQFSRPTVEIECKAYIHYFAGDKKRRDVPAVIDSIWHCLEKSGVLKDDCLIKSVDFHGGYDKENPRAEIQIMPLLG